MLEDAQSLGEVVLVGYGTQRKSDLTGAIASVSSEDVQGQPVANINEAVQGRIPGVEIISGSGEPGAPMQIRIRGMGTFGNTGPLYIVDGMPVSVNDVNAIDPNSIASLDILKDASAAAIYGSRAANGVVLITTKAGKSGKPRVSYENYYGLQTFTDFIPMLNSRQYAELNNDASGNAGVGPEPAFANPESITVDTDWQEAAYNSAPIQNHNLTISGGNDNSKYSVSGGYYDQEGIMVFSFFKRYSARVKTEFKIGDKLTIGESCLFAGGLPYDAHLPGRKPRGLCGAKRRGNRQEQPGKYRCPKGSEAQQQHHE
jgi:TonB-dependent SusC/RagA subfamily outer membrane receptor